MFVNIFSNKSLLFFRTYVTIDSEKHLEHPTQKKPGRLSMGQGKITAKQMEILEYIKNTILKKGYPPAVREICEAVHLKSTSSVHSHLETLEENGYIRRDPTKPRAIEILDDTFGLLRDRKSVV